MVTLKLGFKVVKVLSNKDIRSAVRRNGQVCYAIGKFAVPNEDCGPLTVFKNRKAARKFMFYCYFSSSRGPAYRNSPEPLGLKVFRCLYAPSKEKCVYVWSSVKTTLDEMERINSRGIESGSVALADKVMIF